MEAAEAGSDGAAEAVESGTEGAGGGLDLSPVMDRIGALENGTQGRMERIESLLTQQFGQQEGEEAADEFDASGLFDVDDGVDPQQAQQLLAQLVDQRTQAALDKALGPMSEQLKEIQVGLDTEVLVARYPALGKPEVAQPVVEQARQVAEALGQPELATNTQVLELIYKAQMADKYAAGEKPAGEEQGFELERAGGASPAAADAPNIAQRIVAERQKPYWAMG